MNKAIHILLVDDNPVDRKVFSGLLSSLGYIVVEAATGRDGLQLSKKLRPSLVVLDVRLPDLNGIEVCRRIKEDSALADVFVILFSGDSAGTENLVGGLETGADDYIVKGTDTKEFLARIRSTLKLQEATKALRASERQFREFAENIREVFWMTTPEKDQTLYVSPAYETMWGCSRESLYQSPASWIDAIHPDDQPRVLKAAPAKQMKGEYDVEYRVVRPDGTQIWIQDRAFPIRDESGKIYRIAGIAEDITKRKQMEYSLRESEARQSAIMDAALDGIITFNQKGSILELNTAAQKMFDCARSMTLGRDICELIVPARLKKWFRRGLIHCFTIEDAPILGARVEMSACRADGSEFPAECTITRVKIAGPPVFTAFIRDIHERKQAQAQVSMLAHAVESTAEPICITDLHDRFVFANQAFLKAYGYSEPELLGQTPELLSSPNNPPHLVREILEQSRKGGWQGELLDIRKDGSEFPVFLSTSQIKDKEGKIAGLLGVARDITERKRIQKQQNAIRDLLYALSASDSPEDAIQVIWEITTKMFDLDAGYVGLYSESEDKARYLFAVDTIEGKPRAEFPTEEMHPVTPLMRLIIEKGAQMINRSDDGGFSIGLVPFGDVRRPSESMLHVPMRWSGQVFGLLSVQSYRKQAYTQDDLNLLQTMADHCGNTLKRIAVTEALRKTEADYRSIFEKATEGIYRTTPDGKILAANPALAKMLGYASPADYISCMTNLGTQAYVNPKLRDELKWRLEKDGVVQGFEAELYRKDGSRIWIVLNGHVARDGEGKVVYYEGTAQNITEQKYARQRLADAEELTRTILASSSLGILAYRHTGECVFANEGAANIFNLPVEVLMKQNFRQLEHWKKTDLLRLADETLRTQKFHEKEERWISVSGREVWLNCRFASFVSGGELHLLKLTDDITNRKNAESELRQLPQHIIKAQEAERSRVAGDLHDGVNQLIAAAKVRLRNIQDTVSAASPAAGEIISRVNAMLVQALEENRRVAHNLRPSDLDEFGLLIACRNFCKEFRLRSNVAVRCYILEPSPKLSPESELNLFRIVQEAFNNIEKHSKARNASLRIKTRHKSLILQIRDDGKGFDQNASRRSRGKGRGIGLNNIRERAVLIGGTSTVISAPDGGTTITIRLPVNPEK